MMDSMIGHNRDIAAYNEFRAQLGELREANAKTAFDYEDPKGNKEARSHIHKLRQTKGAVEKARKAEKAASLEYGRMVDEQAKEIAAEIDEMIEVHAKPIQEIEQREKDRVARHEGNLAEIEGAGRRTAEDWMALPLDAMVDRLAEIEAEPIDEEHWEEFALLAAQTKDRVVAVMRDAIAKREKQDAEQAELARLRAEEEERARVEREEEIRREAEQRATEEAERKAGEERARVKAEAAKEREASERRELELKLAAEQAERRAAEAERAAQERARREAEDRDAEAAKREADKKHRASVNRAAVTALVEGGIAEDIAMTVVTLIAQKAIPHVQISY